MCIQRAQWNSVLSSLALKALPSPWCYPGIIKQRCGVVLKLFYLHRSSIRCWMHLVRRVSDSEADTSEAAWFRSHLLENLQPNLNLFAFHPPPLILLPSFPFFLSAFLFPTLHPPAMETSQEFSLLEAIPPAVSSGDVFCALWGSGSSFRQIERHRTSGRFHQAKQGRKT